MMGRAAGFDPDYRREGYFAQEAAAQGEGGVLQGACADAGAGDAAVPDLAGCRART